MLAVTIHREYLLFCIQRSTGYPESRANLHILCPDDVRPQDFAEWPGFPAGSTGNNADRLVGP